MVSEKFAAARAWIRRDPRTRIGTNSRAREPSAIGPRQALRWRDVTVASSGKPYGQGDRTFAQAVAPPNLKLILLAKTEAALSREAPFDSVSPGDPQYLSAKVPFQRWCPRHQAEPEPIINHGETARREAQALAIDAAHDFAVFRWTIRQGRLRCDMGGGLIELAPAERVEKVARENGALALATCKTFAGQVFDPGVHRLADVVAKAARAERSRLVSKKLPVQPGGAGRFDLRGERQVGSDGKSGAFAARRILEPTQLDDGAGSSVAGGIEVSQADVMRPSIYAIDDRVGGAAELIIETPGDEPADDRL
jgi:hypothetical protein